MATQTQTQLQTLQQTQTQTSTLCHPHSIGIQLQHKGMPHGLGLLTTVASLPPKYRSRYLNLKSKCEIPLDLSVKPPTPTMELHEEEQELQELQELQHPISDAMDVPMATAFAEVYSSEAVVQQQEEQQQQQQEEQQHTITPPQSPEPRLKRKLSATDDDNDDDDDVQHAAKLPKTQKEKEEQLELPSTSRAAAAATLVEATPAKPIKVCEPPRTSKAATSGKSSSRNKATRKLKFDEETSSPVSGTVIRPLEDITDGTMQYSNGDIDPKYNIVEITEETKAELAAIKNVIGDYVCRLCRIRFEDAFGLARHRCACIVLLEYRCPECGKQFNCPANLASHRRWHKPKKEAAGVKKENQQPAAAAAAKAGGGGGANKKAAAGAEEAATGGGFDCSDCGKKFKRAAYLRKHQLTHAKKGAATQEQSKELPQTTIRAVFKATPYSGGASTSSSSSSSASSMHSQSTHEDEGVYVVATTSTSTNATSATRSSSSSHYEGDYEADYLSDSSSSASSTGYGRLQIVEHGLTEEESIAAAALTNLRNCASVIQHTTMAH
ncbi:zinc finger protein with KRAB and SCAN domains 8 [Drosophila obscura]|uniref:zinc finger protein with KRAB and SCAN domains 8 n=1 Tax=Drosophila obscura TaxID=7282 RepID=UPI001BB16E7C|nr:zinc finger protein with KRAB and SCAN domains 8 [Drosophila obscura]